MICYRDIPFHNNILYYSLRISIVVFINPKQFAKDNFKNHCLKIFYFLFRSIGTSPQSSLVNHINMPEVESKHNIIQYNMYCLFYNTFLLLLL
jgi:hypothetical protein